MIRGRAAVWALAISAVTLLASSAHAETAIDLPKTKAKLTLDDAWSPIASIKPSKDLQAAYKHTAGLLLAVTRADVPNPDAWVSEKKQAYADQVEKGIKAKVPGYKRLAKKLVDANGIPALDVEAKRNDGAIVVVRVLLFRTYALSIAIEVPKGGDVAVARAVTKAFAPPKEPGPNEPPATPPTKKAAPNEPPATPPTKKAAPNEPPATPATKKPG